MTWYLNDAATRQVRTYIGSYARAQAARYPGPLLEFCGMSGDEMARWAETGEVSDRWLRVNFRGYELTHDHPDMVLCQREPSHQEIARASLGTDWRETMMAQVRRTWPGAADRVQAYIETQVRVVGEPAGCAVCGEPAEGTCTACDRPLCDEHLCTTSVPGDSFCQIGEGCTTPQAAVAEMDAAWEALKAHPVAGPFIAGFRIPSVDEEP